MLKKSGLILLLLCFYISNRAAATVATDNDFIQILKEKDKGLQKLNLIRYIRTFYRSKPVDSLQTGKAEMNNLLTKYRQGSRLAINYFIDYLYQQRLKRVDVAETSLVKAIQLAAKSRDNYLLYIFYMELGFLQTDLGNTTEAVYSYGIARKQAVILDNTSYQATIDVNISDIFYRNGFYNQSLSYLKKAQDMVVRRPVPEQGLKNTIYNNIAENYFRMGNIDSVKKYNGLLNATLDSTYNKYIFAKLTDYYVLLLQHNYQGAIKQIRALKTDSRYTYNNNDEQNLADAYYYADMPDSAKLILTRLLAAPSLKNHPEVKYHLYEVLGKIAEKQNDIEGAAYNFKMALQQSVEQTSRLTQVDNIASQIKIDEVEGAYLQKEEYYKKERMGLIYVLIIALLTVAIIAMIFHTTRQRRYYEKVVFYTKKKELSFINSHEVRRHLSNLLGLIDVIKNSEDKHKEYLEAEPYILQEAESLDGAIKTISEKLESDMDNGKHVTD